MRARLGRFVSSVVVAALMVVLLPQPAFAAGSTPGVGGLVNTVTGWFTDDDEGDGEPPSSEGRTPAAREKLGAGKAERVKELAGRRTPEARFWRMSDGGVQAELAAAPTSYETRGGAWKPIDTAVTTSDAKGYAYANTTNLARSYFGDTPGRLLKVEGELGQSVAFGLKGADGALKPRVEENRVTYEDAVGGADLSYRVGAGEVKEDIVLAERPQGPVSFTFTMDVTDGLTPQVRKDGSVAFFHESRRSPVVVIPAPFMTDARKDDSSPYGRVWSPEVTQELSRDGKGWELTITPDAKWLAADERQFPVRIDPTITIAPSGSESQDVMVLSDQPGVNFAPAWNMSVGTTETGVARALIKFPLDEIPAGVEVDAARLSLYYDQTHTTGGKKMKIQAYEATGAWDELSATWENTKSLVGDLSGTKVQLDDGHAGTAGVGDWTRVTGAGSESDYRYNQNAATGESYTWQPRIHDGGTYLADVHLPGISDAAPAAPYEVRHRDGTSTFTVDQRGTSDRWVDLGNGQMSFGEGTAGSITLGDTGDAGSKNVADAVRLVNRAEVWKDAGEYNEWHNFPVKNSVQEWVNDSLPNNGFVLKASDESPTGTAALGGPRYEAADADYGGETASIPRLTVSWGRIGAALESPTVVHGTGPELHWKPYSNTTGDAGADFVEYQLHRSTRQAFTPSASTLIAPIGERTADSFTDTTAAPSPDPGPEIGKVYYYQLAVKTADGDLLGSPTRIVGIPKAGRTMKLIQGSSGGAVKDTTLSSAQPNTNQDTIQSWGVGQNWLSVGNNSGTYGTTRALLDFDTTSIPSTATVVQSQLQMWGTQTTRDAGSSGAVYELRPLEKGFGEGSATWNNNTSTGTWATPGGDYGATVASTVPQWSEEVGRQRWDATSMTQGWVKNPASNTGAMVKLADESSSTARERSLWLSSEGQDQQLGPLLRVIYVDATAASTYRVPGTPQRMASGTTHDIKVTFTNTTDFTMNGTNPDGWGLSYRWTLPDGSTPPGLDPPVITDLPASIPPSGEVTVTAKVRTPPADFDAGNNDRTGYRLTWDVYAPSLDQWLSERHGIPALTQRVAVEEATSGQLGLEAFYSYTGTSTGAGSSVVNNAASGNAVFSYNAFANPGRGLNTFFRISYNSLDTFDTGTGYGFSAQAAGPLRLGAPLVFHPSGNPTEVRWLDGDGTTHVFTKQADGSFKAPAGFHYKLEPKPNLDCTPASDPIPDAWTATRPDGTRFLFGCDGYLTSVVDSNGNTQTYTYTERVSHNRPVKFLNSITDPAGRKTLDIDYYRKGDASYDYINNAGEQVTGTGELTNPEIYDHVKSVTDISGRKLAFYYTDKGLLGRMTDGAGSGQPKVFDFTYDTTQGNKNVKLVAVEDPRNNTTGLDYYAPSEGDDPKYHWWTKTLTDRRGGGTGFVYMPNAATPKFTDTRVTDAEGNVTDTTTDEFGRPVTTVNAKNETTTLAWDADNNVTLLRENNGAETAFCYDPATGYPLWQRDPEQNNAAGGAPDPATCTDGTTPDNATTFQYTARPDDDYAKDLTRKTSPEGRAWSFGYDTNGNLTSVTDPKGTATPDEGDYTTRYTYNAHGQLETATDPRGNTTTNADFTPTGYPRLITDPQGNSTDFVYDERGQVTKITDALDKTTTQAYDTFGRPGESVVPKDQTGGVFITTPAPVYDANDNITRSTAPNGAISTAVYDPADLMTAATAPDNNTTGRETHYTYDRVGNLKTTTEPNGVATPDVTGDFTTTNHYNAVYQLTDVVNADGDKLSYRYDDVGNPTHVIDPKKNETPDTTDFTTHTTYDLNHRPTKVTDAAGKTTTTAYDKDSLVIATTDQAGKTTEVEYDPRGLPKVQRVPYTDTTTRTTKFTYDQAGNRTTVETPRGTATTTADDFTLRTTYDELNRPVRQYQPYDPGDARYNDPDVYTETRYDAVGRIATVSTPPSAGQTVRNDTTYEYFDNGWIKTATDPWNIVTAYNYTDLGQQKSRRLISAGGSLERPMNWVYYPDGSLKTRKDSGVPDGSAVVLVDNSDTQHTSTSGSWAVSKSIALSGGSKDTGFNHRTQASDGGSFTWQTVIPRDGEYTAYAKYPAKSDAGIAAYRIDHAGGSATRKVDQADNANRWVKLGTYRYKQGITSISVSGIGQGTVSADAVKLVRSYSAGGDLEEKVFGYRYDRNGNLTDVDDTSSGAKIDAYTMVYTGLNQLLKVTENLAGEPKKATAFTYNANGQPETSTHPDQWAGYTYNTRNLIETVKIADTTSETDPTRKTTRYTYTPRGMVDVETKANGNQLDHGYYANGALRTSRETNDGSLVSSHDYQWDENGNKAKDVFSRRNADTGALADTTSTYTYDPADRIAKVAKTGLGAGTETYLHDNNANVIEQSLDGVTTKFDYNRNRLRQATATGDGSGGVTSAYTYDPYGRLESVTADGKILERNTYDGFDRIAEHTNLREDGTTATTTYTYDPLDRTTSQTADAGTSSPKTTDFTYLGLSKGVLDEQVGSEITKSYQYGPWGQRLSQITHKPDGTQQLGVYGYNSHSDVETVTGEDGNTDATYGYTAYGSNNDPEFTGIDKPDPANPDKEAFNPYRFNAKRWDAATSTYDMGFRNYSPGLNRFLTRDTYNGALADMQLGTDPTTGNRYAFTGGNPTTNIELDGHRLACGGGEGSGALDVSCGTGNETRADGTLSFEGEPTGGVRAAFTYKGELHEGIANADTGELHLLGKIKHLKDPGKTSGYMWLGDQTPPADDYSWIDKAGIFVTSFLLPDPGAWKDCLTDPSLGCLAEAPELIPGIGKAGKLLGEAGVKLLKKTFGKCHSFTSGTRVLLADGKTKRIEDVEKGDRVVVTDPDTGETTIRTVKRPITTHDDKKFVRLTFTFEDGKTGQLTATTTHPFWAEHAGEWIDAGDLLPGTTIRTATGHIATIQSTHHYTKTQTTHDLTINDIHTYYVLAGRTPVLVHNASCLSAPNPVPRPIREMYEEIKAGNGVQRLDPNGNPDIFTATHGEPLSVRRKWGGSTVWEVPGARNSGQTRILINPRGQMGYTTDHYRTIQEFSAPHYPDWGW